MCLIITINTIIMANLLDFNELKRCNSVLFEWFSNCGSPLQFATMVLIGNYTCSLSIEKLCLCLENYYNFGKLL